MKHFRWLSVLLLVFALPVYAVPTYGPGLHDNPMIMDDASMPNGRVEIYNSRNLEIDEKGVLVVDVSFGGDWLIHELHLYLQPYYGPDMQPVVDIAVPDKKDRIDFPKFPHRREYEEPLSAAQTILVPFSELYRGVPALEDADEIGFQWGLPYKHKRTMVVVLHADLVKYGADGEIIESDAWAQGDLAVPHTNNGTAFVYEMGHYKVGHFIDSPVGGLNVLSPTFFGRTDLAGSFPYFPGERAEFSIGEFPIGSAFADHKISPLDIFDQSDTDDIRVINMARLLQSLDADAYPKAGIAITPEVEACLAGAMNSLGLSAFDFSNSAQIDAVITVTIAECIDTVRLVAVSAEDAKENLERSLSTTMFRKNLSRTPNLPSSKSKLNIMGQWFPAMKANGEATTIEYFDENGALLRTAEDAKPIVAVYTDGIEPTGYEDIFAAISRDDGSTFKTMNLSRSADRSSFTLANGTEYFGETRKPVFQVKGNKILVAWSSKFCQGGKPAYAIDPEDDYAYDDAYFTEDIWGVAGPQRSVDYAELGFPEVGEVPYSCLWTARAIVATQADVDKGVGEFVGDIVWFKPERLTSGRRDVNQIFVGASDGAGFGIVWQEDPEGLRPGDAAGPGPGWGGATTNHKTDIWYSYLTMWDFAKVDENFLEGGDPVHDIVGRPKALIPMSLPVRLSDNDAVNTDNLMVELDESGLPKTDPEGKWIPVLNTDADGDGSGSHAYAYVYPELCVDFYTFVNEQEATKNVCVTSDNRLLDGDTGASRPNIFMQTYTKPDSTKSAWAIITYEETKGAGSGAPDHEEEGPYGDDYTIEEGKNVIYHSFDFQVPEVVAAGDIVNLPEKEIDADGNVVSNIAYLKDEEGNLVLDWQGLPQIAYENARRGRFILQGKSAAGASGTVMVMVYKEGLEGHGRPSDIMLRRWVSLPDQKGNPYAFKNIICNATEVADNGLTVCVDGAQNVSSVTPTVTTDSMGDPNVEDPYGAVKVVEWAQTVENLADLSSTNPYDDARAHRGAIRGDFVVVGYTYTPNWAAARNGNDKYDFFVRRSFDGGQTWTTDPAGAGVEHCMTWTYPSGTQSAGTKVEECATYAAGDFEQARNLSQLANNKESVIEPRVVATPGTIKDPVTGKPAYLEDIQNKDVFYVSYGTSTNPKKDPVTGEQEMPVPMDLYYSFTQDQGESYVEVAWEVNPDSDGNFAGETVYRWDYLAKGDPEQGEAQLRMTPDGSRFYATWLEEGEEGSDILFRRITPPEFPANTQ